MVRDSMGPAEEEGSTVSCNLTLHGRNYTYSSIDIKLLLSDRSNYAFLLENESFTACIAQLSHMLCDSSIINYRLIPENLSSSDNISSTWRLYPPPIGHEVVCFTFFNETDYYLLFVDIFYNEDTDVRRLVNQRVITLDELNAPSHIAILESVLEDAPQHSIYPADQTFSSVANTTIHIGAPGIPSIIGRFNVTRWLNITGWEIPAGWFHLSEYYSSVYLEYTSPMYNDSLLEEPTWYVVVKNGTHYPGDEFSPRTYTFIYTLNGTLLAISTPVITAPSIPDHSQVTLELLIAGAAMVITISLAVTVLYIKRRSAS